MSLFLAFALPAYFSKPGACVCCRSVVSVRQDLTSAESGGGWDQGGEDSFFGSSDYTVCPTVVIYSSPSGHDLTAVALKPHLGGF